MSAASPAHAPSPRARRPVAGLGAALFLLLLSTAAPGQAPRPEPPEPAIGEAGMVRLELPEQVPLETLIEYVGKRLDVNFLYDERVSGQRVTLQAPDRVPAGALMKLLSTALRMKGLTLVRTEVPGLMRIESANQKLTAVSRGPGAAEGEGGAGAGEGAGAETGAHRAEAGTAVTRVFELEHTGAAEVEQVVRPFLSATAADLIPLARHGMIIVTDYAANMARLARLVALADRPTPDAVIRQMPVEHRDVEELARTLQSLLKGKAEASAGAARRRAEGVSIRADPHSRRLVLVGPPASLEEAESLVRSLDVASGATSRTYVFEVARPERVDDLVRRMIEGESRLESRYRSAVDEAGGLLLVTAPEAVHAMIADLKARLDRPLEETESPIRFYRLKHAKAANVLATLRSIGGGRGLEGLRIEGGGGRAGADATLAPDEADLNPGGSGRAGRRDEAAPEASEGGAGDSRAGRGGGGDEVRITAHEPTNTLIIAASPGMHPVYRELIEGLDRRRPQLHVEATVVLVDTTDRFSLGVEIRGREDAAGGTLLNFTQFGLTVDSPEAGAISLAAGRGFTGALLDSGTAEFVIRALAADSRARVVSRPSILVNDNATGTLASENEEPFESVNASDTVATTSLGGFVTAGTHIEVTPQITEGAYVKLEYDITLSSFEEEGAGNLPPARQTNRLTSEATVPDGDVIVVGGLTRSNIIESVERVPILGELPIIEHLASRRSNDRTESTLFVFLKPRIMRDDKFRDLKRLSRDAAGRSGIPEGFPESAPVVMESPPAPH